MHRVPERTTLQGILEVLFHALVFEMPVDTNGNRNSKDEHNGCDHEEFFFGNAVHRLMILQCWIGNARILKTFLPEEATIAFTTWLSLR